MRIQRKVSENKRAITRNSEGMRQVIVRTGGTKGFDKEGEMNDSMRRELKAGK